MLPDILPFPYLLNRLCSEHLKAGDTPKSHPSNSTSEGQPQGMSVITDHLHTKCYMPLESTHQCLDHHSMQAWTQVGPSFPFGTRIQGGHCMYHQPLDGYVTLLDRPSHSDDDVTQYIQQGLLQPWYNHPRSTTSVCHLLPYNLLPSRLFPSRLLPFKLHCGQSMPLAIVHRSRNLSLTCGTYHCRENMENAVEEMDNRILKETKCHSETIEVPLMEKCI